MVCKKCKSVLPEDALYCEKCGTHVKRKTAKKPAAKKAEEPLAPEALLPLTTAECVGILLVFCVPVLNLILMLVWAYAPQGNESRRSLARAGLILCGAVMALAIMGLSVFLILVNTGYITLTGIV